VIHIDMAQLAPPAARWLKLAKTHTDELKKLSDPAARNAYMRNRGLWGKLNRPLSSQTGEKCWYSEVKDLYSFYDVDHYRPKGRAVDGDGTERVGYWWLAYEWRNYRIAGGIGNRANLDQFGILRGKRDCFPLRSIAQAAQYPNGDTSGEEPALLDPADPADPLLLTFDAQGLPQPTAPSHSWEHHRARTTIGVLHLDHRPLTDRRRELWVECSELIRDVDLLLGWAHCYENQAMRDLANKKIARLTEMAWATSQLSATTRACLTGSGRKWAVRIASEVATSLPAPPAPPVPS
jgi:hypothetical protein